jgi:hypothetical protein
MDAVLGVGRETVLITQRREDGQREGERPAYDGYYRSGK